ncbi:hypothetical protein GALL_445320 [mine drainage metagenome]|uniref:Uncharacterized protein n=1 Tax=mine drainage metagenome TaxID=410659 RepID=A0A1J5Q1S0_9ZZZZ
MIFVQDNFSGIQIVPDLGFDCPWQAGQHIEIVAHHGCLGRHRRHQLELFQLGVRLLPSFFGHAGGLDLFLDLFDIGAFFALAQFFLDGLDLLVQVILTLALLHLPAHAAADALLDLKNADFALELFEQILQARMHIVQVEHRLFLLELER